MPTIRLDKVAKIFRGKSRNAAAIIDISLKIEQGEFLFFVGSRGAGKSTLMDIISGDLKPDRGSVYLDELDLTRLNKRQLAKVQESFGRIRQESELSRADTIAKNLSPRQGFQFFRKNAMDMVLIEKALGLVGMPGCADKYPQDLTPSECRRIQLAQAIMKSPDVLILDEITDQMDEDTIWDMLHLLTELNKRGTTILMATNSSTIVNYMRKRVVTLADGRIVGDVQKGKYGYIV